MAFGVFWLVWILWETRAPGRRRPRPGALHRDDAAAADEAGGLLNAICRLADDGRRWPRSSARRSASWPASTWPSTASEGWLGSTTRFVNDILLSAPSIVIGLFVYAVVVARCKHFSGWAGVLALALIVIPVVIRTTENMLLLVPAACARRPTRWARRSGR